METLFSPSTTWDFLQTFGKQIYQKQLGEVRPKLEALQMRSDSWTDLCLKSTGKTQAGPEDLQFGEEQLQQQKHEAKIQLLLLSRSLTFLQTISWLMHWWGKIWLSTPSLSLISHIWRPPRWIQGLHSATVVQNFLEDSCFILDPRTLGIRKTESNECGHNFLNRREALSASAAAASSCPWKGPLLWR